jgi:hypothetical protein
MKLREEEVSDLVYLGKRLDKVLKYLIESKSEFKDNFLEYIDNYFLPIINGNITQEEEDYFFEEMDNIIDELEEIFSQTFENKIS